MFSLKTNAKVGFKYHGYNDLFSFQLTYHVYIKRKQVIPSNVHIEVAWSSLNEKKLAAGLTQ